MDIDIRYAESDDDCILIHRFLCLVAGPVLHAPIDANDSISEILRVKSETAALMAEVDGEIVGSLGLVRPSWWYNTEAHFWTDRWFFVLPQLWHAGVGVKLIAEAHAIAAALGEKLVINGHLRTRNRSAGGVLFTHPEVYQPGAEAPIEH